VTVPVDEQRRSGHHPGTDAGAEVPADSRADRFGAPVGVERRGVEPEPLGARPQVRVVETALVGEQRVVHRPEGTLAACAASAAHAAEAARGCDVVTGKCRKAMRSGRSRSLTSTAAQKGHSKSA